MVPRLSSPPDYLAVAQVLAPHGVRGEVRCLVLTDFPARFAHTRQIYVGESHVPCAVERSRLAKGSVLLKLAGIDSRDDAAGLRDSVLYVPFADAVALPNGSYFWHEILGLRVKSGDGRILGTVVDILATGSNDVYVVQGSDAEVLLPAIQDVVLDVDLQAGVMTVDLLEGLS